MLTVADLTACLAKKPYIQPLPPDNGQKLYQEEAKRLCAYLNAVHSHDQSICVSNSGITATVEGVGLVNAWFEKKQGKKTGEWRYVLYYYIGHPEAKKNYKISFNPEDGSILKSKGKKKVRLKDRHLAQLLHEIYSDSNLKIDRTLLERQLKM